jgi:hypothetical protein
MLWRFWWGFARPFALLSRLQDEPVAWRAFVRTVGVQALLTLTLGSTYTVATWPSAPERAEALLEARAELDEARRELAEVSRAPIEPQPESGSGSESGSESESESEAGEGLVALQRSVERHSREVNELEREGSLEWWWERLAVWVSSLVGAQLVVLALSRDFQDRLARDLSLVAGLQPEDAPRRTRVRLDLPWLWRKLRRRMRGIWVTSASVVALSPLLVLAAVLGLAASAASVLVAVASAYWWVVFTAARSARAWAQDDDPTPPTPVRVLGAFAQVPWLKWLGPVWVARFARWATKSLAAPARAIEGDLPAFVGLAVARLVASIPVVRIALRAAVIVAAGEVLEGSAPAAVLPALAIAAPAAAARSYPRWRSGRPRAPGPTP